MILDRIREWISKIRDLRQDGGVEMARTHQSEMVLTEEDGFVEVYSGEWEHFEMPLSVGGRIEFRFSENGSGGYGREEIRM